MNNTRLSSIESQPKKVVVRVVVLVVVAVVIFVGLDVAGFVFVVVVFHQYFSDNQFIIYVLLDVAAHQGASVYD